MSSQDNLGICDYCNKPHTTPAPVTVHESPIHNSCFNLWLKQSAEGYDPLLPSALKKRKVNPQSAPLQSQDTSKKVNTMASNYGICDYCNKPHATPATVTVHESPIHDSCFNLWLKQSAEGYDPLLPNHLNAHNQRTQEANVKSSAESVYNGIKELRALIQSGQSVNIAVDDKGHTPLMAAAKLGLRSEIELLVTKGADVNLTSQLGETALSYATIYGHKEVIPILIGAGANPYVGSDSIVIPVMFAARQGWHEIVKSFIVSNPAIPSYIKTFLDGIAENDPKLKNILS